MSDSLTNSVKMDTFMDEERSSLMTTNTRGAHKHNEREKAHMEAYQVRLSSIYLYMHTQLLY